VTSAEEFPEEQQVPAVVLDTPALPIGTIFQFDLMRDNELRLGITVRDENIDDELEVQARLSVVGQPDYRYVCASLIGPSAQPIREPVNVVVDRSKIREGACNTVDVFVSREFVGTCTQDTGAFDFPRAKGDVAHALYYIWETSGDPSQNANAARELVTTCPTQTRAGTTAMPATTQ
jgi:hypothetical protein